MVPNDCRDIPCAPHHVAILSELSQQYKRVLLNMSSQTNNNNNINSEDDDDNDEVVKKKKSGGSVIKNQCDDVDNDIWSVLVNAMEEDRL